MEKRLDVLQAKGWKICQRNARFAFAITEERTLFVTPTAIYEIMCTQPNSRYPYKHIRSDIERGCIFSVVELLTEMRLKAGQGVSYRTINEWRENL